MTQPPAHALPSLVDEALDAAELLRGLAILAPDRVQFIRAAANALAGRALALRGCSAIRTAAAPASPWPVEDLRDHRLAYQRPGSRAAAAMVAAGPASSRIA